MFHRVLESLHSLMDMKLLHMKVRVVRIEDKSNGGIYNMCENVLGTWTVLTEISHGKLVETAKQSPLHSQHPTPTHSSHATQIFPPPLVSLQPPTLSSPTLCTVFLYSLSRLLIYPLSDEFIWWLLLNIVTVPIRSFI